MASTNHVPPVRSNPDEQVHAFRTFLGIPPGSDDPPVCGAVLTSAYNGKGRPRCPECDRLVAAAARRNA